MVCERAILFVEMEDIQEVSHFLFVSTINVLIESICCFTMSYSFHFSRVVFISLLSYVVQVAGRHLMWCRGFCCKGWVGGIVIHCYLTVHAFRTPLDIVGGMHLDNFISTPRHVPGLRWCGSPHVMAYKLTASDLDPHSQILETGRQYRFQVRAINNCDANDPSRSCYGEFSKVQIFTVRDPRAPLPPLMPLRDAGTRVISSNEASITISWTPPITNSGSPIICTARLRRNND